MFKQYNQNCIFSQEFLIEYNFFWRNRYCNIQNKNGTCMYVNNETHSFSLYAVGARMLNCSLCSSSSPEISMFGFVQCKRISMLDGSETNFILFTVTYWRQKTYFLILLLPILTKLPNCPLLVHWQSINYKRDGSACFL